jgi:MGT family glycosyltransferase
MDYSILSLGFSGHLTPMLPVVEELARRGHRLRWFAPESARARVEAVGARFEGYESTFADDFALPTERAGTASPFLLRTVQEARRVLPQVMPRLRRAPPQAVLYDAACLTGRLAAQLLSLPAVKLCPSFASCESFNPFQEGKEIFLRDPKSAAAFRESVTGLVRENDLGPFDLRTHSIKIEPLNLVFMPRAFHPEEHRFDARFAFVGPSPLSCSLRSDLAQWLDADPRSLVYVSFGTMLDASREFLDLLRAAFPNRWRVALASGRRTAAGSLDADTPSHFWVEPSLPQTALLQKARVFVTHGGMNSVQESIQLGVPMVVVPRTYEHRIIARQVEELGLGLSIPADELTPDRLRVAVSRVADNPGVKSRVARMSRLSREAGGFRMAADAVERLRLPRLARASSG